MTEVAPPAPPAPPTPPWYDGVDSETLGFMQSRGLDKLDPTKAALNSIKGHREAMKLLGGPQDQLIRFPKDPSDTENWNTLRTRMGVPADAKDYDFSAVKMKNGGELHDKIVTALRTASHQAGVPKDRAPELAKALATAMDEIDAGETAEQTAKLNAERDALKINWGSNVQQNLIIAKNAAERLGVKPEAIQTLEGQIGYAAVMEMFRNIGVRIGEDRFISGGNGGGNGNVMSKDQASATMAEKMNDVQWTTRLQARDATAMREFDNLSRIIAGG